MIWGLGFWADDEREKEEDRKWGGIEVGDAVCESERKVKKG